MMGRSAEKGVRTMQSQVPRKTVARMLVAAVGSGAMLFSTVVTAQAAPPNCTSADLAGVLSGVTAATSVYLFTHPPVNEFLTSLKDLSTEDKRAAMQAYAEANPQVKAELQAIRQPTADFRIRCGRG